MWIKEVKKKNSEKGKTFYQYQLTETYRIEGVAKHKSILYLGNHELLRDKTIRQQIAKLLESKIMGEASLSSELTGVDNALCLLVEQYYEKYLLKMRSMTCEESIDSQKSKEEEINYDLVDTSSTQVLESREAGAEHISYKILERIGLSEYLSSIGMDSKSVEHCLISIISRAVACLSEHKTEQWLRQNSALSELFGYNPDEVTRHHLYKASKLLYGIKEELETFFYSRYTDMFNIEDKIIIYDLTNTYFEGRKDNSEIAKFGRSKEKRNDCRQVVLAAVINEHGFLKHSRIYEGNTADPVTLIDMVKELDMHKGSTKPIVVMDAGIADEENLLLLRSKGYSYVCVSRSKPGIDDEVIRGNPIEIKDNKKGKIELKFMNMKTKPDRWVQVQSSGKKKKEDSMLTRACEKFELEIANTDKSARKKGGTKRLEKVWERIGRIKERNKYANKYYEIDVQSKDGIVSSISWQKKEIVNGKSSGTYYLRTNCQLNSEEEIWNIYNTVREVESCFRCLKTDLNLRPVYHKSDENIESHLHLGLLAYQIVAPIRYMLKRKGINYSWTNLVRIMNTQKLVSIKQKSKDNKDIIIKTCSRPISEVLEIYQALGINSMPFGLKKYVVHH